MTEVLTPDATMVGGVDASKSDARRYHGRRWWCEAKVRPNESVTRRYHDNEKEEDRKVLRDEGVAVVVGGVDASEGDERWRDDREEEEDR